jgi:mannose-6-phosphate isomerase-like protein (cupin superfamily)
MQEPVGIPRSRVGDVIVGRASGARAIVLIGTEDSADGPIAFHVFIRPGGAGLSPHSHPTLSERFRVLDGCLGLRIGSEERLLQEGADVTIPPGVVHSLWNAGPGEVELLVEIDEGRRFELMLCTLFGLGNDGLTNSRGRPRLLQLAVIAHEYRDVIQFARPPRALRGSLFAVLAPIGQALGYLPCYARYLRPHGRTQPDDEVLALLAEEREVVAA